MELIEANNHTLDAKSFRDTLISWGKENFRAYPWRLTTDPYQILLAEVMLHRTQAPQVVLIYTRFIEKYPDVTSLTQASKEDVHTVLYSLGLRWRIDLVLQMTAELNQKFGGHVPQEKHDLLSLPGVSDYVASTVRCFAWNLPEPIVDTNSVRIAAGLFNLQSKDSSRRNSLFRKLIADLVDEANPRSYNYALLDLAALVCTKVRDPNCSICPVRHFCAYGNIKM